MIFPDPAADAFKECDEHTPTRVLAAAVFCMLEKQLFDEMTARAEIASLFHITAAQLHKAVTGVDYQSGPHPYKGKGKSMDTDTTTPTKLQKTNAGLAPAPSISGNPPSEDAPAKGTTPKPETGHPLTASLQAGETPSETCCLQAVRKNYLMYHLSEKSCRIILPYFLQVAFKNKCFVYLDVLHIFVVGHNIMSIYKMSHYCNFVQL